METPAVAELQKVDRENLPSKPDDGDFVAHCPHVTSAQVNWYWCEDTTFRKGEAKGQVKWLCVCVGCETTAENDVSRVPLAGIAVYHSAPVPTLVMPPVTA